MILTIGNEYDHLLAGAVGVKAGHGGAQRVSQGRAGPGDNLRAGSIQEGTGRGIVGRERELDKARARKEHQADFVAIQPRHQVSYFHLGPAQPVGLDILSQHAARNVQGHHYLYPLLLDRLGHRPPQGPGQRHQQRRQHPQPQEVLPAAPAPVDAVAQTLHQDRIAQPGQVTSPASLGPDQEQSGQG